MFEIDNVLLKLVTMNKSKHILNFFYMYNCIIYNYTINYFKYIYNILN